MGLIQHDCVLTKRAHWDTDRHTHREKVRRRRRRRWDDASTSQGMREVASKPPGARGEAWERVSLTALRVEQPRPHLDLGRPAPRTVRGNTFLCFKPLSVCYFVRAALASQHTGLV